ncbi:MAG: methylmalonyl-CoA mutase family protein [Trueperaceae bacterium]|nr:methylmalonyl-CoA mutase family protein [Trueperaceae bacterium]
MSDPRDDSREPDAPRTDAAVPRAPIYHEPPAELGPRLGRPGEPPFTRGVYPEMYLTRPWTMRQYAGFASAEASNARYRRLLAEGSTGLSVAFDLPTQLGLDPDDPLAAGEVGRVGVSIATVDDMDRLFAGIPLDEVTTSMTINAPATMLLAMYTLVAERRGTPLHDLNGTVQNDILKEYAARGTYVWPIAPSMRLVTDLFAHCARELPAWNTISISGYHIREAGATAAQELAFTLANAEAYVRAALRAGLEIDAFAPRLSFFFACHSDLFEEVAKFRVARRAWERRMRERFGAEDPRSLRLRFHAQTGGSTLTAQQLDNNVVRTAYQALAAVLGGTQSLHTNAKDEALGLPTEATARTALRTQQILLHETGVADAIDPLAGSYYLEHLCDALEAQVEALLRRIDDLGGAVAALESGMVHEEIEAAAYRQQQEIEEGRRVVVGVNRHREEAGVQPPVQRVDADLQRRRAEEVQAFRAAQDGAAVSDALDRVRQVAAGTGDTFGPIRDALRAGATLGDTCGALRQTWGVYEG